MSLRERILSASDLKSQIVEIPEWGCRVEIREMSARGRMQWRSRAYSDGVLNEETWGVSLLLISLFDPETGSRIFETDDLVLLNEKNDTVLGRLLDIALEINGLKAERSLETVNFSSETQSCASPAG